MDQLYQLWLLKGTVAFRVIFIEGIVTFDKITCMIKVATVARVYQFLIVSVVLFNLIYVILKNLNEVVDIWDKATID